MSDIIINTKRASTGRGFDGMSDNDLTRIAAQAIDYAGEISEGHEMADVLRDIRDSGSIRPSDDNLFSFDYDGMTFEVMTEEFYNGRCEAAMECAIEGAEWEFENQFPVAGYLNDYISFDKDKFARDLQYDIEAMVSHYDGQVHEMYWNEYKSGDGSIVTRRETLYMIRED